MPFDRHCRDALVLLLPLLLGVACHDARTALDDSGLAQGAAPLMASPLKNHTSRAAVSGSSGLHQAAADALRLPADFPADVFVPVGYTVNSVMDSGPVQVVSLQSRGRVSSVFADARGEMRAQGWTQTLAMQNAADNAMLSFEKDGRAVVLSFERGGSGHDVTTSVQLRRAL